MSNVGIYKITSPTGKVYIGQSVNMSNRFSHYRYQCKSIGKQRKLYSSLMKYGFDNHKVEIAHELPKDVSREVLNEYEILYMQLYKDAGVELLNLKDGGLNGRHSEETKQKQRLKGKLGKPVSEETRAKIRAANIGRVSYMKGKRHSEKSRLKMSESQKKRTFKPTGHKLTYEQKQKMQEGRKKVPHPFFGKHHSRESKDKVSRTKKGCKGTRNVKVICSITGVIFDSIGNAALSIGMKPSTLVVQLRKDRTTTTFKYL